MARDTRTRATSFAYKSDVKALLGKTINMGSYKSNEKAIGTWIDGKTIYRRVITTTNPLNTANEIANLSTFFTANYINVVTRAVAIYPPATTGVANVTSVVVQADARYNRLTNKLIDVTGNGMVGADGAAVTIILEYTKQ